MSNIRQDPWDAHIVKCMRHMTVYDPSVGCPDCVEEAGIKPPPAGEYVLQMPGVQSSGAKTLANRLRALADEVEALAGPRA